MSGYLALLRGVNVGGRARVEMGRVKTLFLSLGRGWGPSQLTNAFWERRLAGG
ncbi:MAG: DUF1697 domain-containing protein [Mycobacteriales bacterium]